jgi:hypothetical protein
MNSNELVDNLDSIRTVSVKVQEFIHDVCGKITDNMKLYDLKLKEIQVLENKIKEEKENRAFKPGLAKVSKTKKLKNKLREQKQKVQNKVQEVASQHDKLIVNILLT